jgi:hypothetical protein
LWRALAEQTGQPASVRLLFSVHRSLFAGIRPVAAEAEELAAMLDHRDSALRAMAHQFLVRLFGSRIHYAVDMDSSDRTAATRLWTLYIRDVYSRN